MSAISSKYPLINRSAKHKFRNEAIRCAEYLQHIIDDFIDLIFEAPNRFNYDVIYKEFLDRWKASCRHLKTVKPKLKMINIDEEFFAKEFAPSILSNKKFETRFELLIF